MSEALMTMSDSVLIIAEAGVNHNGSMDLALKLIDAAAEAGADVVKFQTFKAENLASKKAPKADYQVTQTGKAESQFEMLKKLELSDENHIALISHCQKRNIKFLSTPFDLDSLALLHQKFNLDLIKLGSGELTNAPLLLASAQTGKDMILSTGMGTMEEIEDALGVLAFGYSQTDQTPSRQAFKEALKKPDNFAFLKEKVTLLHCTTEYPAPFNDVNLRAMDSILDKFGLRVGYSDHTPGVAISLAAAARGACVIEKHFTLDQSLPGPDHKASMTPTELNALVLGVRQIEQALGDGIKRVSPSELKNKTIARKSLVAKTDIKAGDKFTSDNLTIKRPGNGRSPLNYWETLGQKSAQSYNKDDLIK